MCFCRWQETCVSGCGSKALCLYLWVSVWGSLRAVIFMWLPVYNMSLRQRCGETLWEVRYVCDVCVVGRVGAVVCVWVMGVPCIVFVSKWCGATPPEHMGPNGSGAAWYAPYLRFAKSCQGACWLGKGVGAMSEGRTPPSGSDRGRSSSAYGFLVFTHSCNGAMRPSHTKICNVHAMGSAVFGKGADSWLMWRSVCAVQSPRPPSASRCPVFPCGWFGRDRWPAPE